MSKPHTITVVTYPCLCLTSSALLHLPMKVHQSISGGYFSVIQWLSNFVGTFIFPSTSR